eukprot:2796795-Pyramimonas_sp.AAC.1
MGQIRRPGGGGAPAPCRCARAARSCESLCFSCQSGRQVVCAPPASLASPRPQWGCNLSSRRALPQWPVGAIHGCVSGTFGN